MGTFPTGRASQPLGPVGTGRDVGWRVDVGERRR